MARAYWDGEEKVEGSRVRGRATEPTVLQYLWGTVHSGGEVCEGEREPGAGCSSMAEQKRRVFFLILA
jgi:hypothetical protein